LRRGKKDDLDRSDRSGLGICQDPGLINHPNRARVGRGQRGANSQGQNNPPNEWRNHNKDRETKRKNEIAPPRQIPPILSPKNMENSYQNPGSTPVIQKIASLRQYITFFV
jgi:hypothetical protein